VHLLFSDDRKRSASDVVSASPLGEGAFYGIDKFF